MEQSVAYCDDPTERIADDHYRGRVKVHAFLAILEFFVRSSERTKRFTKHLAQPLIYKVFSAWRSVSRPVSQPDPYSEVVFAFRSWNLGAKALRALKEHMQREKMDRTKENRRIKMYAKVNRWLNEFKPRN
jgi:hypothetical protein